MSEYPKPLAVERFEARTLKEKEVVAEALARGELRTLGQKRKVARVLECKVEYVEHLMRLPEIVPRVQHLLRMKALQITSDALNGGMASLAQEDVAAFKVVAQIAEVIKPSAGVQVNTLIDKRNMGDTDSDRKFFDNYHRRVESKVDVIDVVSDETPAH